MGSSLSPSLSLSLEGAKHDEQTYADNRKYTLSFVLFFLLVHDFILICFWSVLFEIYEDKRKI